MKRIGLLGISVGLCSAIGACAPTVRDYNSSSSASSGQGGDGGSAVSSSSGMGGMGGGGPGGGGPGGGGIGGVGGMGTGGAMVEANCRGGNPECGVSCSDGIQNQGEKAIDCGGPCKPCPGCMVPSFVDAGYALAPNEDARTVVATDLNGDALPDLIIAGNMSAQVYLNAGVGTPPKQNQVLSPASNAEQIAALDIDGDCDQDVVTVGNEAIVWMNDGKGNLNPIQPLGMPSQYIAGEIGVLDVDGEGVPDLVIPRYMGYEIWQNRMKELGIFVLAENNTWKSCIAAAYGCRENTPIFAVRANMETNTWARTGSSFVQEQSIPESGSYNYGVALGDLNLDGHLDLVLGDNSAPARVYSGDGAGVFTQASSFGYKRYVRRLLLADFNTDGYLDVAMANWGLDDPNACNPPTMECPQRNEFWMNDGKGNFLIGQTFGRFASTYGLATVDIDGDGDQDLIAAESNALAPQERSTRIYLNDCSK